MEWDLLQKHRKEAVNLRELTEEQGRKMLSISKRAISAFVTEGTVPENTICDGEFNGYAGVFVTLKENTELRGCVGFPYPVYTLCEGIIRASIAASSEDPRFTPLEEAELDSITIEVSVLGFPEEIDQLSEKELGKMELGKHGLIVRRGHFNGLLLPQVAVEEGFDREGFISATCVKAGLSPAAWKDRETEVYIFEGRVFPGNEKD